ncbi:MAG: AEC family transporter [Oligoflexia bacterium]|nr:AEC family transporter [Oligoflexia bacterium]
MDTLLPVAQSVFTLCIVGFVGFSIVSRKLVPANVLDALIPLVLDIALPCLVFIKILKNFTPASMPDWWLLPLWWAGFTVYAVIISQLLSNMSGKFKTEFRASLLYQNGIFFPAAIIMGTFGKNSPLMVCLFIFILFYPAFFFNTYPLFFGKKKQKISLKGLSHPVLFATLIAIIIKLTGTQTYLPAFFYSTIDMLAGITIPMLILIIGGNIYLDYTNSGVIHFKEVIKFVLARNILMPLLTLGIILMIKTDYNTSFILFIQSAVPPLTAIPVFARKSGADTGIVNQYLVFSILFSVISLPVALVLFDMVFHH